MEMRVREGRRRPSWMYLFNRKGMCIVHYEGEGSAKGKAFIHMVRALSSGISKCDLCFG